MTSILVIDDEAPIRHSLELLLELKGFDVRTAADGHEGLRAIEEARPDLVITDVIMPGSGIDTLASIKADQPDLKVIVMSGGGRIEGRDVLQVASEVGADTCMRKPFAAEELFAELTRLLPEHPVFA
ncbi:MAG: response regulator [Novosphingobium sp.]|nr:response regulator [Novosphingobium sp.]